MYDGVTALVDWSAVLAALGSIAAAFALVYAARRGYVWVLASLGYKDMGEGYSTKSSVSTDSSGNKTVTLNHRRH